MGKEPVDNHNVTIATKGTGHVAQVKPAASDFCYPPNSPVAVGFDNYQPSSKLHSGETTKTLINGHSIWTQAGLLDAELSLPRHIGTLGGAKDGGAYCLWSSAKTFSQDLVIEKFGVVRTHDETYQNRKNAYGYVSAATAHAEEDDLDDKDKKACFIVKVKGHCKHKAEAEKKEGEGAAKGKEGEGAAKGKEGEGAAKGKEGAGGGFREFGPTPGGPSWSEAYGKMKSVALQAFTKQPSAAEGAKPAAGGGAKPAAGAGAKPAADGAAAEPEQVYLGVFAGDAITLEADREDTRKSPSKKPPECKIEKEIGQAAHTHWLAVTTGNIHWAVVPAKDLVADHIGDKWTFQVPGGKNLTNKAGEREDPKEARKEQPFTGPGKKEAQHEENAQIRQEKKNAHDQKADIKVPEEKSKGAMALELGTDLLKAYQIWMLYASPPTTVITARACGGAKVLTLQIYPEEEFAFNLFSDTLKAKMAFFKGISTGFEWVSKNIGSVGGVSIPFKFEFLQNPKVELKIAYKELTEDKNGCKKNEVRASWNFCFGFEPFVKVQLTVKISIFKIAAALGNAATPATAAAIEFLGYALGKVGITGYFTFGGSLEVSPDVELGCDEYGIFKWVKAGEVAIIVTLFIGLEANGPGISLTTQFYAEGKVTLGDWAAPSEKDKATKLFTFKAKGRLQFGAKGAIAVDFVKWIWNKPITREFDFRPKCLCFPEAEAANLGEFYCPMPQQGHTATPDPVLTDPTNKSD